MLSMLLAFSMSGCEMIHAKIHGYDRASPAPGTAGHPPQPKNSNAAKQRQPSRAPYEEPTKQVQATTPQRQTRGQVEQAQTTDFQRQTGEKLLETDLYELYGRSYSGSSWCFQGYEAAVKQIFKVGAEFVIKDDATYAERFEREILPILKARCRSLTRVDIDHYIKGVRIDQWMKEYGETDYSFSGKELALSHMNVTINPKGILTYTMYREESLAALRAKREALPQEIAKGEVIRNKWRKRAEESAAQQRAAEEAAEQKLAATNATADGQLRLSGIENEYKRLFLMIYDSDLVALSERKDIQDLPLLLYRSVIRRNDELCRASIKDAVPVVEKYKVYDHQEIEPFTGRVTEYYRWETRTTYMTPRYEGPFRSADGKSLLAVAKKVLPVITDPDLKRSTRHLGPFEAGIAQGMATFEVGLKEKERIEKAKTALSVMLPPESCGRPGPVQFMDNLTRYITHDYSDEYAKSINGTYPYTEKIGGESGESALIERFYKKIPPTFSPEFLVPAEDEEIVLWLNKDNERAGLKFAKIAKLNLMDLTPDHTNTKIKLPSDVQQAIEERKYFVVQCSYLIGRGSQTLYYWNAKGPLPSDSVQAFAKRNIFESRTSCPINGS